MSIRPDDQQLETNPPWMVQAVFDPDGLGGDFAYTIGLSALGVPELHIYGRPSLGEDPGADWKFSCDDLCRLLNELGAKLVRGETSVGSVVEQRYDGGLVRVRFRVDPPGDREELEAFGVPPGADVLPVRWSLHRDPEGPLEPMTPEAKLCAAKEYAAIHASLGSEATAPGWQLPAEPSFGPAQRYGPRTAVILGRAAELWECSPEFLANLIGVAGRVLMATGSLTYPAARARSIARTVGRSAHAARLDDDVQSYIDSFERHPETRPTWQRAVKLVAGQDWRTGDQGLRQRWVDHCLMSLSTAVLTGLLTELVADVAPADLVLAGRGPLMAAGRSAGVAPAKEWFAAEEVMKVFDSLTDGLDRRRIGEIGARHLQASDRDEGGYGDLEDRLLGWSVVSAAAMPDLTLGGLVHVPPGFQRWACALTSALTHRARLTAEEVGCLAAPMRELLPALEGTLNAPIALADGGSL